MDILNKVADKDIVRERTSSHPIAGDLMKPMPKLTKLTTRKVFKLLEETPTRGPIVQVPVYPVQPSSDQMSAKIPPVQALLPTYNKSYLHHEPMLMPLPASLNSEEMARCDHNPCANGGTCFVVSRAGVVRIMGIKKVERLRL